MTEAQTASANKVFKDLGLSQTQAQALIDHYAGLSKSAAEEQMKLYNDMRQGWKDEVAKDPQLGPNQEKIKVEVSRLIDSLGDTKLTADFRAAMDLTGAGDHPAMIRVLSQLAKKYGEGTLTTGGPVVPGRPEGQAKPTIAQALYPNLA